ncbi:putative carboxylesterase [Whalleya microplaca]|nr:putative carboxylesterase [Whalleya microplaca]
MKPRAGGWLLAIIIAHVTYALASSSSVSTPDVNLGYATYRGSYNDTYGLNIWKSIRYAAAPIGKLRWQAPQAPPEDNWEVLPAVDQPPICPQTGAFGVPSVYGFNSGPGDEDCLYLNVYAAQNASGLPVLVWIHGGGHNLNGAIYDPSEWMAANDNGFVTVEIQYRLGAFGFLSSADIKANGQLNAGLLDQRFALEWVQKHVAKFGGDPSRVTIGGESSGAGAVFYHVLGYGGKESDLFNNVIAASPYIPSVYRYSDPLPTSHYNKFAELVGCGQNSSNIKAHSGVFECLVAADTEVLQNASGTVSTTEGYFGSWAFLPVIDGEYIQERPAVQSLHGDVSGKRLLVGNNANDGSPLTNPEVRTRAEYDSFISTAFPLFNSGDIALLNSIYQIDSLPDNDGILFDTLGSSGPTALSQSSFATGIQQATFNIAAETTFDCPAQWLAEAFSTYGRQAWKYQYSVTPSFHGADLNAYFSTGQTAPNADFQRAMRKMWGNFIMHNTPVISLADATANYSNASVPVGVYGNIDWPEFTLSTPWQMNLNTTGGNVSKVTVTPELSYFVRSGVGIVNNFSLADAFSWEGGRGYRCGFWRTVSERVPQ